MEGTGAEVGARANSESRSTELEMAEVPITQDFSAEVRLAGSGPARLWYLAAGHLSIALAILGAFLPLLPCTPFLLLAAGCYARGSVRFYNWLLNHRLFGPMIRNWRDDRSVAVNHKIMAIAMITVSIGTTVVFFVPNVIGKIVLSLMGLAWVVVMLRIPTRAR